MTNTKQARAALALLLSDIEIKVQQESFNFFLAFGEDAKELRVIPKLREAFMTGVSKGGLQALHSKHGLARAGGITRQTISK